MRSGRVVSYEGVADAAGTSHHPPGIEERLRVLLDAGDEDGALAAFLGEVVGMSPADLDAYRADPVWPVRAAAAGYDPARARVGGGSGSLHRRFGAVRQPVLQILGGASLPVFRDATLALDARLDDGRVTIIDGARHAAHHTHPDAFVAAVRAFWPDDAFRASGDTPQTRSDQNRGAASGAGIASRRTSC